MTTGGAFLAPALDLAARGWPVFPCGPNDKRPLVPPASAPGAKDGGLYLATTDEAKIRAWARTRADAMIGVRMGPGCGAWVVDFDPYADEETGEETTVEDLLAAVERIIGEPLPATLTSLTPRGGRHMLFRWPEDDVLAGATIGNSRGALPLHVDIRGEGGYIIAPPSVRRGPKAAEDGCDGVAYRWLDSEAEIAEAPRALIDAVLKRGRFAPQPRGAQSQGSPGGAVTGFAARAWAVGDPEGDAVRRYGLAALDNAARDIAGAGKGARNQTINDRALAIGHLVGAGALSRSVAYAALYDACLALGLNDGDKALVPGGTLERALDDGAREPVDLSEVRRKARERAAQREARQAARTAPQAHAPMPAGPEDYGRPAAAASSAGGASGDEEDEEGHADESGPSEGAGPPAADETMLEAVRSCAGLDHSDTDNGRRLIAYFGANLAVFQRDGVRNTDYLVFTGTHWDLATGNDSAFDLAQRVGAMIGLEADYLVATPHEARAIEEAGEAAAALDLIEARRETWTDDDRAQARRLAEAIEAGKAARAALDKRKVARRKFGVSSKNKARLEAMLACAAPRLARPPRAFNAHPFRVATKTHTLTFSRHRDDECPDPDAERQIGCVEVVEGHARSDFITAIVDADFAPRATAPRWDAFLTRFLPNLAVRRFVQVAAGLGLLGVTVQRLIFHYGEGANGKSVFMQVIANLLGALASTLSPDAITGTNQRQGNQANPELARLYAKRFVRVSELPEGVPLQEELVKRLTGGEELPVRGLFQGIFDFKPVFIAHMSGNGYPRIEGTNHGIWRRMAVVHWPVILADDEQRPFDDVVGEFMEEASGVLNWLVEGARLYMEEGLVIPPEVAASTKEYRDEMDPIGDFITDCVEACEGQSSTAREMYMAYVSYAEANAIKPIHETRFGKLMRTRFKREDGRIRRYLDCRLHDVPERPSARNPDEGGGWARDYHA